MKRNIKYIVLFLIGLWGISCTTKSNMQPEGDWDLSEPKLIIPSTDEIVELNEVFPNENLDFEWEPSINTADYIITYSVVLVRDTATSYDNPLIEVASHNNGKSVTASISHKEIDLALAQACYPKNEMANTKWGVKATSLSRVAFSSQEINIKRFSENELPQQLFIYGTATEVGEDQENAIPMKGFVDGNGEMTHFETVTSLIKDETYQFVSGIEDPALRYGTENGELKLCGSQITATESGVFIIKADFKTNTVATEKINFFSIVGTPIEGEWGGDVPLTYQGNGLFQDTVNLKASGSFIMRIDGDWGRVYKQRPGTTNLIYEAFADNEGLDKEDLQNPNVGDYIVSVDFLGTAYTYSFEKVESELPPLVAPETLFLLPSDGSEAIEFNKDGNTFTSPSYLALQAELTYTLNSSSDGSGTSYILQGEIGATEDPTGDNVFDSSSLKEGEGEITVARDQAYQLTLDFGTPSLSWQYYNIKLFHWLEWDDRIEVQMTYEHPYTFTLSNVELTGGNDSKFNSPWDVEFGASDAAGSTDDATATTGTATNKAFADESVNINNFKFISTDGTYNISLEISNDYRTANYSVTQ
ncbi:hypothetical protein [Flammeovirga agarivorans]|uniref:SusE outer membrane protein domain-containing protein n=1 Tax=Flammeovirga agarivorans TaxID=2726742 RepID=A0A7X8SKY7_9BACT|nr:hypothetical protein [Flammeovirga agarivorans]NLR92037.1 hypothetical protein [Flammeovirga agarivorans]